MFSFLSSTVAILAATSSLVSAAPAKRDSSFSPKSFATTGWGGTAGNENSAVHLYYATNGGIQEVIVKGGGVNKGSSKPKFDKGSFLATPSGCSVADTAPLAASSTYSFGIDGIQVFYLAQCGQNRTIKNWEYSGGSWRDGGLAVQAPAFDANTRMNANAYPLNGGYALSLFYSQGGGFVQEFQRTNSDFWTWQGDIGKVNQGVEFTSQVSVDVNGNVSKKIWTADNIQLSWSTSQPQWATTYGVTHFLANHITSAQINGGETHFYVTNGADRNVYEWVLNNDGSWQADTHTLKSVTDTPGSQLDTAVQNYDGKNWIYVFYLNKSGKMAMSWFNGKKWYDDDHKVEF